MTSIWKLITLHVISKNKKIQNKGYYRKIHIFQIDLLSEFNNSLSIVCFTFSVCRQFPEVRKTSEKALNHMAIRL